MSFFWALLFLVAVLLFWFTNLLGLPGNWLIVATTVLYAWLMPGAAVGWPATGVITGLAVVGELVELAASAAGVKKSGGSGFGAIIALVGSVIGAITGMFVGIPIPVIGSLMGAVLFGGLGALCGAMVGETLRGRSFQASWNTGVAAFWGRLLGTFAKVIIGAVMAGIAIAAMFVG
jgi:uncharacterized protein YqgC (DUF456 family)